MTNPKCAAADDVLDATPAASTNDDSRMTPSAKEQAVLQLLVDRLSWRVCTPEYAAKVGPHEYVVRYKTCAEEPWAALQEAIRRYGRRERYLVTGNTFTYLVFGEHRYWTAPGWEVINRARQADVLGKYGPPGPPWRDPTNRGVEDS